MAQNRTFRSGPTLLSTTLTTPILNPPTGAGGTGVTATNQYMILRHIRIVNRSATPTAFSLWLDTTSGGNTAGKEFIGTGVTVAGNSFFEWFGLARLDTTDFLNGGALVTANALVIEIEGELGVAG